MNAAVQNLPTTGKAPAPMEVLIKGRIEASRRHDGTRYTRILTPAPDAYSRPQVLEVRSKQSLGQSGDEISVTARLGGFTRKAFRATDKETGEVTMVTPVDLTLDAVE
ncbi:single-stranded DNA-binding protein [Variovorax sp. VNK109]|uniref:single-stranded DNA-binding protein n=1 Tax=Variovorax sp. VNK109 TaxID=3400919 RepID=UPI003C09DB44